MKKKMMKSLPFVLLLAMPTVAAAQLSYSFYEQSPHDNVSYMNSDGFSFRDCGNCHTDDGVTGSWAFYSNLFLCTSCHGNESGPPYTLHAAPAVESHSATAIAADTRGTLVRGCGSCHHGPTQNDWAHPPQIDHTDPLLTPAIANLTPAYDSEGNRVWYMGTHIWDPLADTTTFPNVKMTINNANWSDVSTWNKKTGEERGLMLEVIRSPENRPRNYYAEIVNVTTNADDTINIVVKGKVEDPTFRIWPPMDLRVFYGQEILSRVFTDTRSGSSSSWPTATVRFLGPQDAATSDGLGTGGSDSTPDGICQVCHTTTTYWRADGSGTEHNNGMDCLGCHDHKTGFLPKCNSCHGYPPTTATSDRHARHNQIGYGCQTCHYETTTNGVRVGATHNNGTVNVAPAPTFPGRPADGPQALTFTFTPAESGGTCSANTCHAYWGFSETVKWEKSVEIQVEPRISTLSSLDTDRVVTCDASRSSCFETVDGQPEERTCSFTWDFGGNGSIIGGNGNDIIIYRYDTAGTYAVSLSMTESTSGKTATGSTTATAAVVEALPTPTIDFSGTVSGKTVTLTANFPADVTTVLVYWGDRKSTRYSADLANAVMSHTYSVTGKTYEIRVQTLDASHNRVDYTVSDDGDLRVTL